MTMHTRHGIHVLAACLVLLTSAIGLRASTIDKIALQSKFPDYKISEEMAYSCIVSKAGAEFDRKTLAEDIRRLAASGFYEDVEALQSLTGDKVTITFVLTPCPRIRSVAIEGNNLVKTKKLEDKLTIKSGGLLAKRKVQDDTNAVRKVYQDKGYYQTQVTSVIQPIPDTHDVNLIFRVTEEARYKVDAVRFAGNTMFTQKELRKKIQTSRSFWSLFFNTGYLDEEKLKQDEDAIYDTYTSKGCLDFRIEKIDRELDAKKNWVTLVIHVVEGQPYQVSAVDVAGNEKFPKADLMALTQLQIGKTFDSEVERKDGDKIKAKYELLGYLDLRLYPRHKQNNENHTVAVTYDLQEGGPSTVHDIAITGNEVTQDRVIRRELTIMPGDLGNAGLIRESRARLMGLGYFEKVDITHTATEKEDEKDLVVDVKEKMTGSLSLGAGFSSEEDIVGTFSVTQANFDLFNSNWPFSGGGQKLALRLQAGTQSSDYALSFTEPWLFDRRLRLDFDLYHRERDQDYYTQTTTGTRFMLTKEIKKYWRHGVGYRYDMVDISGMDHDAGVDPDGNPLKDQEGNYNVSALIYRIQRDSTDSPRYPNQGSRTVLETEYEAEPLGSYSNVYRADLTSAKYYPVFQKSVFKLEGELGTVDSFTGQEPAIFDRYFAGGMNSIRGFKRRDVGPVDEHDNATGGRSLMRGTAELMYPIYEMIRGSVFSDFGNVWWKAADWDPTDLNASVGVGVLLDLPIGPIRLDYGIPVITQEPHLGSNGRFHFNVQYSF